MNGYDLNSRIDRIHFAAKARAHRRMAELGRTHRLTVQATRLSLALREQAGLPTHDPVSLPGLGVWQGSLSSAVGGNRTRVAGS